MDTGRFCVHGTRIQPVDWSRTGTRCFVFIPFFSFTNTQNTVYSDGICGTASQPNTTRPQCVACPSVRTGVWHRNGRPRGKLQLAKHQESQRAVSFFSVYYTEQATDWFAFFFTTGKGHCICREALAMCDEKETVWIHRTLTCLKHSIVRANGRCSHQKKKVLRTIERCCLRARPFRTCCPTTTSTQ